MTAHRNTERTTGARLLVEQLKTHGVERIFCVPGESFLAVLDALVDTPDIHVVTCRHESGATMMAEAYGKLTGRPGIAFVTRGPGATNGSAGVHIAHQDSTPLILFVGQIERGATERGAFQEIDYRSMFQSFTKWTTQVEDGGRLPELVSRAFHTATAGRPGPVVMALPEDMLVEDVPAATARPYRPVAAGPTAEALAALSARLREAERPILIVGGGGWSAQTARDAQDFCDRWRMPVCASFRCQDFIDNTHPNYVGNLGLSANPSLVRAIGESDLVVLVGGRLGEVSSNGYSLLRLPCPDQDLLHVHPDPEELGRVYRPSLAINAASAPLFAALRDSRPPASPPWADRLEPLRDSYLQWTTPGRVEGPVQMGEIMTWLRERLPGDAVVTNGAGNFAIWPNRYHRYGGYKTMLAPVSGSMGYGIPAAVSAKIADRDRVVVAFAGDGDFLMTGQELATAAKEKAGIIVILLNNAMYGTIRMHQERHYPERVSATDLHNPDFVALAEAYGAFARRVGRTEEFAPAFEQALSEDRAAVIEIVLDQEVISPGETIASLRGKAPAS